MELITSAYSDSTIVNTGLIFRATIDTIKRIREIAEIVKANPDIEFIRINYTNTITFNYTDDDFITLQDERHTPEGAELSFAHVYASAVEFFCVHDGTEYRSGAMSIDAVADAYEKFMRGVCD